MKTITNEIKAKYYNQYQFSHVCFEGIINSIWTIGVNVVFGYYVINGDFGKIYMDSISPLLLTSLEQISDEDKKELDLIEDVADPYQDGYLSYGKSWEDLHYNNGSFHRNLSIKSFQYLISKGYALPYMEYSVDDLIKLNVIKLK